MSTTFECGDNRALVSYLYEECDAHERAAIAAHVAICAACAAELAALESTRMQLASWSPPEADLGFAIGRPQASGLGSQGGSSSEASDGPGAWGLRPGTWFARPRPAWAQLAAAVVIFAAGLVLGIARGTMREPSAPAVATRTPATPAAARVEGVTPATLDALEARLRGEIAALRSAGAPPAATVARGALSAVEGQLLARVRALIDESEQRQQRELAVRMAQIIRDVDSQRRVDLEQIQRNFGQIEGLTGAEVREQRQMLNYLMRVSQPQ